MEWQQLITDIYVRISQDLERALDGLTVDELNQQPTPDSNSIGWLAWHLTRSRDRLVADLTEEEQLWIKDKWYIKFERAPDATDTGFGHSSEDVATFRAPGSEILLEYHHAVQAQLKHYIENKLSEPDLKREVKRPTLAMVSTVRTRLAGILNDNLQHVGQVNYVRGLLKGKGWYGR